MGYYSDYTLFLKFSDLEALKVAKKVLEKWVFLEELKADEGELTLSHYEHCKGYDLNWILSKLRGIVEGTVERQGEEADDYESLKFNGAWIVEMYEKRKVGERPMDAGIDPVLHLKGTLAQYELLLKDLTDSNDYKTNVIAIIQELKEEIRELEQL